MLSDDKLRPKCYLEQDNKCKIYPVRPKYCRNYPLVPEILKSEKAICEESAFCPGVLAALAKEL